MYPQCNFAYTNPHTRAITWTIRLWWKLRKKKLRHSHVKFSAVALNTGVLFSTLFVCVSYKILEVIVVSLLAHLYRKISLTPFLSLSLSISPFLSFTLLFCCCFFLRLFTHYVQCIHDCSKLTSMPFAIALHTRTWERRSTSVSIHSPQRTHTIPYNWIS